jgi:hypothetical protein
VVVVSVDSVASLLVSLSVDVVASVDSAVWVVSPPWDTSEEAGVLFSPVELVVTSYGVASPPTVIEGSGASSQ